MAAFRGEVAFVLNNINIRICDCLMVFLRGEAEESVVQRHTDTTNMLHLLTELCQRPGDVSAWGYSVQQSTWLFERLGPVVGADRVGRIKVLLSEHALAGAGPVVDSPILFPLLCALLSPDLLLIPLARMLAASRRGRWTADDKTFVVQQSARGQEAMGPLWVIVSEDLADLGTVRVVARGNHIQWVELDNPWPAVQRPSGSQFLRNLTFRPTVSTVFLEKPPVLRRRCHGGALAHGGENALEGCLGVLCTASPGAEGYHCVWRSTKV